MTQIQAKPSGIIVQCIGAVIDVEFAREAMPHVYDALKLDAENSQLTPRSRRERMWARNALVHPAPSARIKIGCPWR